MSENSLSMVGRLKAQMEMKGLNPKELAQRADVGRTFIYDILSGKSTNPTTRKIASVAEVLGVGVPYLLEGITEDAQKDQYLECGCIPIPELSLNRNPSSTMTFITTANNFHFRKDWLDSTFGVYDLDNFRITFIEDDTMAPALEEYDMVLVDITEKHIEADSYYAVYDGEKIIARTLLPQPDIHYQSLRFTKEDHIVIGKIIWYSRALI